MHFHAAENYVQDIMHDVFKGVCAYDIPLICSAYVSLLSTINYRRLFTNCVLSSTGACIRLHRSTFKSCTCQSQPPPVVVACSQLLVKTYTSAGNKNCHLRDPAVSLWIPLNFGSLPPALRDLTHWTVQQPAKNSFVLFSLRPIMCWSAIKKLLTHSLSLRTCLVTA